MSTIKVKPIVQRIITSERSAIYNQIRMSVAKSFDEQILNNCTDQIYAQIYAGIYSMIFKIVDSTDDEIRNVKQLTFNRIQLDLFN